MILGLKRPRPRRKSPRKVARNSPGPARKPEKEAPAKLPIGGPKFFEVRTRLAKSVGIDKRYKLNAIRVLPTKKKDTVVLQVSDGIHAVCVMTRGKMSSPRLVPSEVLPTRKSNDDIMVALAGDEWRSSDGKTAVDMYDGESCYPPVSDVLPRISNQGKPSHVKLGIDLSVLSKVAESLGTSKLTLFVPIPRKPVGNERGELFVTKPVAVCPANDEHKVRGVGVLMPLQPVNGTSYYMKARQVVADAEERCKAKARSKVSKPRTRRRAQPV
jgi:hypothetical protein